MVSGQILGWASRFAYRTGDFPLARRLAEEQLRLAKETGGRAIEAWALQELGRLALAEGDLAAARRWGEQSQAVSGSSGDDMRSMAVRLQRARLAVAEKKAGEAERLAREAASWYAAREISKGEALSLAVVAQALLLQGRPDEAQRAAARLRELMKGEDRELRVLVIPAVARAEAAGGNAEALRDLEREIAEAARIGLVTAGLEARLAQGEILLQQGNRARGHQVLQGVRREAEARKLGLFAKRAVEISQAPGALLAR
jgi:ATP/maltotriose-dependent transcriptional regulator MalT